MASPQDEYNNKGDDLIEYSARLNFHVEKWLKIEFWIDYLCRN